MEEEYKRDCMICGSTQVNKEWKGWNLCEKPKCEKAWNAKRHEANKGTDKRGRR